MPTLKWETTPGLHRAPHNFIKRATQTRHTRKTALNSVWVPARQCLEAVLGAFNARIQRLCDIPAAALRTSAILLQAAFWPPPDQEPLCVLRSPA